MSRSHARQRPRIVLGVTSAVSLRLLRGFPEHLVAEGWDVHVVAGGELPEPSAGVTHHRLEMRRDPQPWHDLRALLAWVRLLHRLKPDVVSTGTPKAGMLGMVAAWLTRRPVRIYKLRGLRLETSSGSTRRVLGLVERLTTSCSQWVIAVSPSLRRRAVDLGLAPARKVVVLGAGSSNGVDLDRFDPSGSRRDSARERTGVAGPTPVIGFLGRVSTDKGIGELLDAAAHLDRQGHRFTLLVVGPTEDVAAQEALDRAVQEGISVRRLDFVEDPVDIFHAIDVLCLPTRREGFPNVVLEAGASGIPTVTTTATGAIDSVVDGRTGFLATVEDGASIADALGRLLADPDLRRDMGRRAREHVEAHYRREDVWKLEAGLYADELRRADGPPLPPPGP